MLCTEPLPKLCSPSTTARFKSCKQPATISDALALLPKLRSLTVPLEALTSAEAMGRLTSIESLTVYQNVYPNGYLDAPEVPTLDVVAAPAKAVDDEMRQPDAHAIRTIGAVENENAVGHDAPILAWPCDGRRAT